MEKNHWHLKIISFISTYLRKFTHFILYIYEKLCLEIKTELKPLQHHLDILRINKRIKKLWLRIKRSLRELLIDCCIGAIEFRSVIFIGFLFLIIVSGRDFIFNIFANRISFDLALSIISTYIGILAALLGIIVAVLLVAFEILRKGFNVYAFRAFFENKSLRELIQIFISTILVGAFSLFLLSSPPSGSDTARLVLLTILFTFCMIILFPCVRKIIVSTRPTQQARLIVESATEHLFGRSYHHRFSLSNQMEFRKARKPMENPMILIGEVGVRAIAERDQFTPNILIIELDKKVEEFMGKISNKRDVIKDLIDPVSAISTAAVKQQREDVLHYVLYLIESIYRKCAESKTSYDNLIELDRFLDEIAEDYIKAGMSRITKDLIYMIIRIMKKHLEINVPSEEKVHYLMYRKHGKYRDEDKCNTDSTLQWEHFSRTYIGILDKMINTALDMRDASSVSTIIYSLSSIQSTVMSLNLGDMQKDDIISQSLFSIRKGMVKCIESGIHEKTFLFPVSSFAISEMLESEKHYSKEALMSFGSLLIMMDEKRALDKHTLNEIGTVGRGCTDRINSSKINKEALAYIISILDKLREKTIQINDPYSDAIYIEVYQQMKSLKNWMEKDKKYDPDILALLEDALSKFTEYDQRKKSLESRNPAWPTFDNNK